MNIAHNILKKVMPYVLSIATFNFISFILIAAIFGGDALNGKIEQNHFYLSWQGKLTEVSEATYLYSKYHGISVLLTHILAIVIGFLHIKISSIIKGREIIVHTDNSSSSIHKKRDKHISIAAILVIPVIIIPVDLVFGGVWTAIAFITCIFIFFIIQRIFPNENQNI